MSPENRTPVPPKPFLIRHGRLTSSILAPLVVATGMLAFAGTAAAAQPPSGGDNHCYRTTDGRHPRPCLISIPGPQGRPGPQGIPGPAGPCIEIDSIQQGANEEFAVALVGGKTFGGHRRNPPPDASHLYEWTDLTTGTFAATYPTDACAASLNTRGNDLYFKVITPRGRVFETVCATNGSDNFDCDATTANPTGGTWVEVLPPPLVP
jgi:hypothetical protein